MNRFIKAIASTATVAGILIAGLSTAAPKITSADGTGQIEGGTATYLVKNLTTGGAYGDNVAASCNDELQYGIRLHNTGFTSVKDINVKIDALASKSTATITFTDGLTPSTSDSTNVSAPANGTIAYEAGSTKLYDGAGTFVNSPADGIVGSGINLGSLNGSTTEYLTLKAKVNCPPVQTPVYTCDAFSIAADSDRKIHVTDFKTTANNGASFVYADIVWGDNSANTSTGNVVGQSHTYAQDGTYTITVTAHFNVNGVEKTVNSAACTKQITVHTDTNTPIYTCDLFTISAQADRTVKVTAFNKTAKNGATFNNVVIDWGDSSDKLTSNNPVGKTHQYSKDGTYTLTATAHFTVNGNDVTASGAGCTTSVTFSPNQPPVVTPPTVTPPTTTVTAAPTTLVNTGAGSVIGLFAAVTVAGSIAYRNILARRLSRQ